MAGVAIVVVVVVVVATVMVAGDTRYCHGWLMDSFLRSHPQQQQPCAVFPLAVIRVPVGVW